MKKGKLLAYTSYPEVVLGKTIIKDIEEFKRLNIDFENSIVEITPAKIKIEGVQEFVFSIHKSVTRTEYKENLQQKRKAKIEEATDLLKEIFKISKELKNL